MANTRNSSNDAKQNIDPLRTSWKSLLKRINGELLSYSRPTGTVEAKLLSPHAAAASNATPRLASPLTTSARCHYRRRVRGARKLHSETEKKKSLACLPRCFNGLSAFRPLVKSAYFYSARHVLQPCYVYTSNSVRPFLILAPSPAVNARVFEDLHVKRLITQFAPNYPHTFTTPS